MYDVLIVEDDPMVAMINKQYVMQNSNFRVCESCRDGQSAWDYIQKNKVDLVILDQYMPEMKGLELLRLIRQNDIPVSVIMVTAANDSSSVSEALRLGIVDYLVKPFSNARFNQALESFIARQEVFNDSASFDQKMIDDLINVAGVGASKAESKELPKGIQEITLNRVREYMKVNSARELTNEEIADDIGVSRVTARRYMTYLLEQREINGRMNYDTGGRPSMLYRYIN